MVLIFLSINASSRPILPGALQLGEYPSAAARARFHDAAQGGVARWRPGCKIARIKPFFGMLSGVDAKTISLHAPV